MAVLLFTVLTHVLHVIGCGQQELQLYKAGVHTFVGPHRN